MAENLSTIRSYEEILAEARAARDIGESLSSVTHALCALGLDLLQVSAQLDAILTDLTAGSGEGDTT